MEPDSERQASLPTPPLPPPPMERRLMSLLAAGQTPAQAAGTLRLPPAEAEAMLASLLRRHGLSSQRRLLARALLYRWL